MSVKLNNLHHILHPATYNSRPSFCKYSTSFFYELFSFPLTWNCIGTKFSQRFSSTVFIPFQTNLLINIVPVGGIEDPRVLGGRHTNVFPFLAKNLQNRYKILQFFVTTESHAAANFQVLPLPFSTDFSQVV